MGYTEGLLPAYIGLDGSEVQMGFAMKFWRSLKKGDTEQALREMQAYLAGISLTPSPSPIGEGSSYISNKDAIQNNSIASVCTPLSNRRGAGGEAERFYEYTFYLIFSMLNVYARTQVSR